jgi:hypothetical protein
MAALTSDEIVDRVRSICASEPFGFTEAVRWDTFENQPTTNIDSVFRVPPPSSQSVTGGFDYTEDRVDVVQIWVARKHQQDYATVRRALLRDMHSLTAAVTRDSGDYAVLDGGRGHTISPEKGQEYISLRLSLPVNYEVQL